MICELGNVELFELCETTPKVQCSHCLLYWNQGIVYCTCGQCLIYSESRKQFNKLRLEALSIPKYVIKKGKTSDIDDNGRIIRSPDALRPLTLCNCDCKLLTSAICRGLLWYTKRCIHPSQRCISSRQMTDKIFEIETTALPHVACAPQGSGVLLTDFAAAYPSVNHSWIFSVLENTGLPGFLCRFLRSIYKDSITHVEFAGADRGQFLMVRGVRQGCPARGFLFAMAFDPIFRWLQESIIPRTPDNLDFLQPVQCAYADDLAVASFSFRELLYARAPAFHSIDCIAGLNLNYRKCCWVQYGSEEHDSLRTWISENCEEFRDMQIVRHAKDVGTMIGPDGHLHRWTAPRKNSYNECWKSMLLPIVWLSDCVISRSTRFPCWVSLGLYVHQIKPPSKARTMPFSAPLQDRATLSPLNFLRLALSVD